MPPSRYWTEAEDAVVRSHGHELPDRHLARRLGRSLRAVQHRRQRLGVKKNVLRRWGKEEDETIRLAVGRARGLPHRTRCLQELATALGRRISEVSSRSRQLGLGFRTAKGSSGRHGGRKIIGWRNGKPLYEHIAVMERELGRCLRKGECVHHLDCDKDNNHIDNLFLCGSISEHRRLHCQINRLVPELMERGLITFNRATGVYEICETSR